MDRLYNIKKFDYISDLDTNMIELYIEPDDDLILYIKSIPKLEPKILINLNGHHLGNKELFQTNYFAVVDNISNYYNDTSVDCLVFIIYTCMAGVNLDFVMFPNSGIEQPCIPSTQEECNDAPFNGSDVLPPLSYYNPMLKEIVQFSAPKNRKSIVADIVRGGTGYSVTHKMCKAEQLTEPPLANLKDVTPQTCGGGKCNVVEYFDENCPGVCKKKLEKCKPFNYLNLNYVLILLLVFGVFFAIMNYIYQYHK